MSGVFWMTAFLDLPADSYDETVAFWQGVTGHAVSPARGERGEFATLVPPVGDDHLRVQRLGDDHQGGPRIHLDLHVPDARAAADRALRLGATEVAAPGHVVMASPGGLPFCFVEHRSSTPAPPTDRGDGLLSAVDQVCLDIPRAAYAQEVSFWSDLTGAESVPSPRFPEFARLRLPPGRGMVVLLQLLGESGGPVRAHLDLATTDRARETGRHLDLGARLERVHAGWTVLTDPSGAAYCVTDRRPETGSPSVGGPH